jgi:diacylglycerol kinase
LGLGIYFRVSKSEAVALILVASSVLVLELINSTLERVVDYMKPRLHHYVEVVKDMMAGAVLVASLGAAVIGIIIFYP